jgi:hypothetical protein
MATRKQLDRAFRAKQNQDLWLPSGLSKKLKNIAQI